MSAQTHLEGVEEWRMVPNYPNYRVSTLGRVESLTRGILTGTVSGKYTRIQLRRSDGSVWQVKLHQVVAWTFLGPQEKGMHVAHANCNSFDNRLCNLRYATPRENVMDSVKMGRLKLIHDLRVEPLAQDEKIELHRLHGLAEERIITICKRFKININTFYRAIAEVGPVKRRPANKIYGTTEVNKNGGTAETVTATEQPTETADKGSLPQGKTGEQL